MMQRFTRTKHVELNIYSECKYTANEEVFDSAELCASLGHVEKWLDLALDWLKMRGFEVSTIE